MIKKITARRKYYWTASYLYICLQAWKRSARKGAFGRPEIREVEIRTDWEGTFGEGSRRKTSARTTQVCAVVYSEVSKLRLSVGSTNRGLSIVTH